MLTKENNREKNCRGQRDDVILFFIIINFFVQNRNEIYIWRRLLRTDDGKKKFLKIKHNNIVVEGGMKKRTDGNKRERWQSYVKTILLVLPDRASAWNVIASVVYRVAAAAAGALCTAEWRARRRRRRVYRFPQLWRARWLHRAAMVFGPAGGRADGRAGYPAVVSNEIRWRPTVCVRVIARAPNAPPIVTPSSLRASR